MSKPIYRRTLNERLLQTVKPQARVYLIWDAGTRGLALSVRPNRRKTWKFIYAFRGRTRWFTIADADALPLADARKRARELRVQVDQGIDPQAEKKAKRSAGTFGELAERYRDEYAKKQNKSWPQAAALVNRFLIPRWGKLRATDVTRADVEAIITGIDKPALANAALASASAIFAWGIRKQIVTTNPCALVERNSVKSRERILSAGELPNFWNSFGDAGAAGVALKLVLLTGQRPGEIGAMQRRHIDGGWWTMPGEPQSPDWPGTKNAATHSVWLSTPAQLLIDKHLAGPRPLTDRAMRQICSKLGVERATAHDLRRTFLSTVTGLGYGRDAMDRIANHKTHAVTDVYDRHGYRDEDRRIMEATAARIVALIDGEPIGEVIPLRA
jgi:integrase